MTSRHYVFTVNSKPRDFYDDMTAIFLTNQPDMTYICGQLELASTGQIHFQGYVQLKEKRGLKWLKNQLNQTAHFEVKRGTNEQARDYCKKPETRVEAFIEEGTFIKGNRFYVRLVFK